MGLVVAGIRNVFTRLGTIFWLTGGAFFITYTLIPKMEYLPEGTVISWSMSCSSPGLSYDERSEIGKDCSRPFSPISRR